MTSPNLITSGIELKLELIWNWTSMVLARVADTPVIHLDNPVSIWANNNRLLQI